MMIPVLENVKTSAVNSNKFSRIAVIFHIFRLVWRNHSHRNGNKAQINAAAWFGL